MSRKKYSLRFMLQAFTVLAIIFMGTPVRASWSTVGCYFGWSILIGLMWYSYAGVLPSRVGDDPNREHARALSKGMAVLSTMTWFACVVMFIGPRIWLAAQPTFTPSLWSDYRPDQSILVMTSLIFIVIPIGFFGLLFSLFLYWEPRDWRLLRFQALIIGSGALPVVWLTHAASL